ncbi:hypothetical protein BDR07DRAFT_1476351 [Suillus spraguei]|nr:hypothetical protein BDR07DRAFT_1476351 [Suillus spraguei]
MKEEQAQNQQPADVDSQDKAPQKCHRITHPEPQPDAAALSNSACDKIPIDPVLLSQDATVTARLMRDVKVLTNIPDPLVNTPSLMRNVEVMTNTPDPLVNTHTPQSDQPPPSPAFSVLTELDSRDLATPTCHISFRLNTNLNYFFFF